MPQRPGMPITKPSPAAVPVPCDEAANWGDSRSLRGDPTRQPTWDLAGNGDSAQRGENPATQPREHVGLAGRLDPPHASCLAARFGYFAVVDLPLPRFDLLIRAVQRRLGLDAKDPGTQGWYPSREAGLAALVQVITSRRAHLLYQAAPSRSPGHADHRREGGRGDRERPLDVPAPGFKAPTGAQGGGTRQVPGGGASSSVPSGTRAFGRRTSG